MDLSEEIVAAIRARNAAGETYAQLSKVCGLAASQIHRLANRKQSPLKMSVEKLLALFPRAKIELEPSAAGIGSDSADADLTRRADALQARERELAAERRELDAIRRELAAERRLLELEREARPPAPAGVLVAHDPLAPYQVGKSTSSSKE